MAKSDTARHVGKLSVVATPIGNLGDWSPRAREVLAACTSVAAEDTRHSANLLRHFGIDKALISLHEHNEEQRIAAVIESLRAGAHIALISDAGTPGISDPGFRLLRAVTEAGIYVEAIPGPCAAIAALSIAGLPTDRFVFEGFLPVRSAARRVRLDGLRTEDRTMIFYEAPHRAKDMLEACAAVFGDDRAAVVARELTKKFESLYRGTLGSLAARAAQDLARGELVVLIAGASGARVDSTAESHLDRVLGLLLPHLPLKQAAAIAAQVCECRENESYRRALALRDGEVAPTG